MRAYLNSLPTMTLIAMAGRLGCIWTGALMTQRSVAINFLWQVAMSSTVTMTVTQFIRYYNGVIYGDNVVNSYFVEVK